MSGSVAGLLAEVTAQDLRTGVGDQLGQCIQGSALTLARVEITLRSRDQGDASMPTSNQMLNHRTRPAVVIDRQRSIPLAVVRCIHEHGGGRARNVADE